MCVSPGLVVPYRDKWLVFHGGPNMVHFSSDGIRWTGEAISQFGSRNHVIRGNTIYSFAHVDIDPDPDKQEMVAATFQGMIRGETIDWGKLHRAPRLTLGYYEDLQQDGHGHFTVSGRVLHRDDKGKPAGITIEWARSVRPNDITAWGPQQQVICHTSDMKCSEVHENLPLEDGKSYVIGMISVNGQAKLYGNLFDGKKWREQDMLLAENMSTVRGTDKRMSVVWDPNAKVIQLSVRGPRQPALVPHLQESVSRGRLDRASEAEGVQGFHERDEPRHQPNARARLLAVRQDRVRASRPAPAKRVVVSEQVRW